MKKEGKYRFSLQFGSDSEEQIRVGEFLESLGKKKSVIIVEVLNDYLLAHPELWETHGRKIEVNVSGKYDRRKIEQMIRTIIEEKIASLHLNHVSTGKLQEMSSQEHSPETVEEDIEQMLNNLDFFQ